MTEIEPRTQENAESHPLAGETDAKRVPASWLAGDEPVAAGETRYYAVLYTVERELADADVLAGRRDGRGEEYSLHVLYVRGDGCRRVERSYPTRIIEGDSGVRVEPRREIAASIAVDGDAVTPVAAPRSDRIVAVLDDLHDCTVPRTGGGL